MDAEVRVRHSSLKEYVQLVLKGTYNGRTYSRLYVRGCGKKFLFFYDSVELVSPPIIVCREALKNAVEKVLSRHKY